MKRGRPPMDPKDRKVQVTIRLDSDVIAEFKRRHPKGWMTAINNALKEVIP